MPDPILKPKASYEIDENNRRSSANDEAKVLAGELRAHKAELDDHGFELQLSDGMVAIKRGDLDIVRIVFNYGDTGKHRVTNGVAEALRRDLFVDHSNSRGAMEDFKMQLQKATDLFYENRSTFQALGLI